MVDFTSFRDWLRFTFSLLAMVCAVLLGVGMPLLLAGVVLLWLSGAPSR